RGVWKKEGIRCLVDPDRTAGHRRGFAATHRRLPQLLRPSFRLFDNYRDEDFYGLPQKYSIVARVEVKFSIEPRFRDRQHFVLSDIN
ncbi:hypothetical protein ACJX0J_020335, partial [Zea mays]